MNNDRRLILVCVLTIATGVVSIWNSVLLTRMSEESGNRSDSPSLFPTAQAAEEERVDLWALWSPVDACHGSGEWGTDGTFVGSARDDSAWVPTRTVWCLMPNRDTVDDETDHVLVRYVQPQGSDRARRDLPWNAPKDLQTGERGMTDAFGPACGGAFVAWSPGDERDQGRLVTETDGVVARITGATGGRLLCLDDDGVLAMRVRTYDGTWVPSRDGALATDVERTHY